MRALCLGGLDALPIACLDFALHWAEGIGSTW